MTTKPPSVAKRLAAALEAKNALIASLEARADAADARADAAADAVAAVHAAWDALDADVAWTASRAGGLVDGERAAKKGRAATPPVGGDGPLPADPFLARLLASCPDDAAATAAADAHADTATAAERRLAARAVASRAALAAALDRIDAAATPNDATVARELAAARKAADAARGAARSADAARRSAADRAAAAAAAVVGEDVPAAALPPAWRPAGVEGSSPGAAEVLLPPPSPTAAPAEMPPPPPRAPPALTPPPHLSTIAERAAAGDLAVTLDDVRAAAAAAAASAAALAPAPRPASTAGSGWTLATAQSAGAERTQWWAGGEGGGFAAALRVAPDGRVWRKRGAKARSGGWLGAWLG